MKTLPDSHKYRLYFILGCFIICFLAIIGQAIRLQVIHSDYLTKRASGSTHRLYSLGYVRGDIFDRNGEKLATSVAVDSVFVDRRALKDVGDTAYKLWTALYMDYETINKKLERLQNSAYLKRHVTVQEAQAVKALGIKGVGLIKEYRRDYPNGTLASHFLGFVGNDGNGLEGLELALEDKLVVDPSKVKVRRDGFGRIFVDEPGQVIDQPKGASVVLTLDMRIQNIAEKAIAKAAIENNAKSAMAIVVKPSTGEILASAVYPSFDPNNYSLSDMADRRNKVLTDPLEPGSTLKIFTVSAALEEGLVNPDTVFFCENGLYQIDTHQPIRDTGIYGDLSVSEIVKKSSNIGASKIGERLGSHKLYSYLNKFGFGQKTGLSYPAGESAGMLRSPSKWHVLDAANISFGQGISVTALQLVMAASALANDGVLMRPSLVSRVIDAQGNTIEHRPPQIVRQVVSPLTARQVMAMTRMAVMKGGTGRRADIEEYPVAGKTGTAQKVDIGSKGYASGKYVASFVGVAPYHNPELCILVILDEPYPAYHGGEVAAPVFKEIMSQSLPLLDIPPVETPSEPAWPVLDRPEPGAPGVLMSERTSYNYVKVILPQGDKGDGPVKPLEDMTLTSPQFEFAKPVGENQDIDVRPPGDDGGTGVMPNLAGLSMREVLDLMTPYHMALEYHGSGISVTQHPPGGAPVVKGQMARVVFEAPSR
ncbi:MAG: transpeptidase family protein [Deltaproteobacteria bacterium]|jgi:cell division protein FtsI (penicillin-binding protein 3)|nr:transpeptidase family protein [Deltaproteobacteria bacterium]